MKNILCYGDSNTYGYIPGYGGRFSVNIRWPGVLQDFLGSDFNVIEAGLNGRTTIFNDPFDPSRNGKKSLLPCLKANKPLDLVIIYLGINDLKPSFAQTARTIARGAGVLVDMVQKSGCGPDNGAPEVLLLVPPPAGEVLEYDVFLCEAVKESRKFSEEYRIVAHDSGCYFMDLAKIISSSEIDGVHLDAESHEKLGLEIGKYIKKIWAF